MADRPSLRRLGERVLSEITELVGCPAEGITGLHAVDGDGDGDGDAGWVLTVEVLEMARVPETGDLLATYEVHVDDRGQITEFERKRRYIRGQADS